MLFTYSQCDAEEDKQISPQKSFILEFTFIYLTYCLQPFCVCTFLFAFLYIYSIYIYCRGWKKAGSEINHEATLRKPNKYLKNVNSMTGILFLLSITIY